MKPEQIPWAASVGYPNPPYRTNRWLFWLQPRAASTRPQGGPEEPKVSELALGVVGLGGGAPPGPAGTHPSQLESE